MKKLLFKANRTDKNTAKLYEAGNVYEFDDERAEEILKTSCAILVDDKATKEENKEDKENKEEVIEAAIKEEPKKEKAITKRKYAKK